MRTVGPWAAHPSVDVVVCRVGTLRPTLVGTFPLGLQVGSDLDVICSAPDFAEFERRLPAPVWAQLGFRHMAVEARLLAVGGDALRERVRALKRGGVKTEPAFAEVLALPGDPYCVLLELETWSLEELRSLLSRALLPQTRVPERGSNEPSSG